MIDAAVDRGRPLELPPINGVAYRGFCDASGGVGADSYTVAVSHKDSDERLVVDVVRGTAGKFDPAEVTRQYAALLKDYRVTSVTGDSYAAQWAACAWRDAGITYEPSELPKSQIYLECIPLFTRNLVRLPDQPRLLRELRLLERTTHRSGKDSIQHPRNARDDFANSACGALHLIGAAPIGMSAVPMSVWQRVLADVDAAGPYRPPPFSERQSVHFRLG